MTSPDETNSKPQKRKSGDPFLLVKAGILAVAAFFVLSLVSHLLSWRPFSWITLPFSTRITIEEKTLESLLDLTEVEDIEKLLAAEFFGEVIVSPWELEDRVFDELTLWIAKRKECQENEKLELSEIGKDRVANWYLTTYHDHDVNVALEELFQSSNDGAEFSKEDLNGNIGKADIVYLPRGHVKVWYDLDITLKDAACRDSEGNKVEPCDLSRVASLVLEHEKGRQITVTINPYFRYHKETVDQTYTHGWEIIKGGDQIPDLEILEGLRILAHEELRNIAFEHGILAHADASLNATIERMIELFFDETVEVVSEETDTGGVPMPSL